MEKWEEQMRKQLLYRGMLISEECDFINEMNKHKINNDELAESYYKIIDQVEFLHVMISKIV